MKGFVTVADAAQAAPNGKVSVLGACWTTVPEGPSLMSVVSVIRLAPGEEGKHSLQVRLSRDEDDMEIAQFGGDFTLNRAENVPQDSPLSSSFAFTFPALALSPGTHTWVLEVDSARLDEWPFAVLEATAGA